MFQINSNIKDIIAQIQAGIDQIPDIFAQGVEELGQRAVTSLEDHCPIDEAENNGTIPGEEDHLKDSFVADTVFTSGTQASVEIVTLEPIKFQYVTQGTMDVSPIYPVNASVLWLPGDHPVAYVSGQEANPFQEEALADVEGAIPEVGDMVVANIALAFGG